MRQFSLILVGALLVAGAACASAPASPPAPVAPVVTAPPQVDPVGAFDFSTTVEGSMVNGTVTVARTDTGFGGTVTTTMTEPIPVRSVVVEGQKMTVTADTPDGPVVFLMEFKGDDFTGTWTLGTMSGSHSGKRRKA
jgi:hypothetical protein